MQDLASLRSSRDVVYVVRLFINIQLSHTSPTAKSADDDIKGDDMMTEESNKNQKLTVIQIDIILVKHEITS